MPLPTVLPRHQRGSPFNCLDVAQVDSVPLQWISVQRLVGEDVAHLFALVQTVAETHLTDGAIAAEVLGASEDAVTRDELIATLGIRAGDRTLACSPDTDRVVSLENR
ncbi:hypothetical protein ACFWPK_20670 [Nocardia sp. NPDC058519]|uniref:hypothetical protein n=1 Tax=Nocardia sp. NPDC058519 TaxID=3346535 RepID=UPI00364C484A